MFTTPGTETEVLYLYRDRNLYGVLRESANGTTRYLFDKILSQKITVFYTSFSEIMLHRVEERWERVLLKAGPRPTACDGPAARRTGGSEARWLSPGFRQFFCSAVNPRACTDLHRVRACKMDDGDFEFVYHFKII